MAEFKIIPLTIIQDLDAVAVYGKGYSQLSAAERSSVDRVLDTYGSVTVDDKPVDVRITVYNEAPTQAMVDKLYALGMKEVK